MEFRKFSICSLAVAVGLLLWCGAAAAQATVEAYAADGFGVAKVTLQLADGASDAPAGDDRIAIESATGHVLYPAIQGGKSRKLLESLLGIDPPRRATYYFLFLTGEPFEVTAFVPDAMSLVVRPQIDDRRHRKLFQEWWKAYAEMYARVHGDAEYPVGVQTYLTTLWSQRLNVEMPRLEGFLLRDQQKGGTWLGKTMGDEAYRASVLRDTMLGQWSGPHGPLTPIDASTESQVVPSDIPEGMEPLARVVPEKCFYIRFGSYQNYSWTKEFLERSQGDLTNLIALRSIRRDSAQTVQNQLGLSESSLSKVLGPSVINDVAFVGLDPYLRDGAAFGILFEAKNNFLLSNSLNSQRRAAAGEIADSQQETIELAGQSVSFAHSPGRELCSYYARRDNFHLVTTSRSLAQQFLQAGQQTASLAQTADFQQARAVLPAKQNGTVLAYVSRSFWQNLTSPQVRIEFERRQRVLAEIEALRIARYAARQEGVPASTAAELVEAQYLPPGFGTTAEGAFDEVAGQYIDRERGTPGRFVPIADMPAEDMTAVESARYAAYQRTLASEAGVLPPVMLEIDRAPQYDDNLEHVRIRLRVGNYAETQVGNLAKKLAGPTPRRVAPILGDVVSLEVLLDDPLQGGQPIHLFAGLRNAPIPLGIRGGGLSLLTSVTEAVRGYIGFWPKPGLLEALLGRPRGPYDADGCVRTSSLLELWTRRLDGFFLFSFKRDVLMEVGSQLAMIDAEPAQARLFVDDLAGSQLEFAASALGYARARQTSASGSRFMNALHRQLQVPKPECLPLAEQFIDGEFVCPLGGRYLLVEIPGGVQAWASTAAAPNNQFLLTEIPADFRLPLLTWFRGFDARLTTAPDDAMLLDLDLRASGLLNEAAPQSRPQPAREPTPAAGQEPPLEELPPPLPRSE